MTSAELSKFRRRIGDKTKSDQDVINIQQADRTFKLRFSNVDNVVAYVNNAEKLTGFTVDKSLGLITFTSTASIGDELRFDYTHTAYLDSEITSLVDEYGFDTAVVEVLSELLSDSSRLYDYSEGATSAQLSQVFDHLKEMLAYYQDRMDKDEAGYTGKDGKKLGNIKFGKRISSYYMQSPKPQPHDVSRYDDL